MFTQRLRYRPVHLCAIVAVLIAAILLGASPASAESSAPNYRMPSPDAHADGYIVRFASGTSETVARNAALHSAARPVKWLPQLNALVVHPGEQSNSLAAASAAALFARSDVLYVEPNVIASGADIPNDSDYGTLQWAPQLIGAEDAWSVTHGSSSVVVAVLDTGVDATHPDLAGRTVAGYDFVNVDSDPTDDNGHGTGMAGVIGAATNNGAGIASIGWDTAIMPVKVLNSSNLGNHAEIAAGIMWAADNGASIINLSLSGSGTTQTLGDAVNYAHGQGALVVAAAGNGNTSTQFYPAAYTNAMAIAATKSTDDRWILSNFGSWISMAAPGDTIWTTNWSGGSAPYLDRSGTSLAAPHVSAVAALLLAVDPSLTNADLRSTLESTSVDLGDVGVDDIFGAGRLDAAAAVAAIAGTLPDPDPTEDPPTTTYTKMVNAGGGDYVDGLGETCAADQLYLAGEWGYTDGVVKLSTAGVAGTIDDLLYQNHRESPSEYRFDVPNGEYEVTLRFAEFVVKKVGDRVIRVSVEGTVVEESLSIYGEVGKNAALDKVYTTSVADGQLTIALSKNGGKKAPVISAVSVVQLSGDSVPADPPPTDTPTPDPDPTDPPPTDTPTPPPDPDPTDPPPTDTPVPASGMHVADIDGAPASARNKWESTVTVTVHDSDSAPLAGVEVSGAWSGGYTGNAVCITDSNGQCSVVSGRISKKSESMSFAVSGLVLTGEVYDAASNRDPDGDSDGTLITIFKP